MTLGTLTRQALVAGLFACIGTATWPVIARTVPREARPGIQDEARGLQPHKSRAFDRLLVREGLSLAAYKRVRLEPVDVGMDKDWDPNADRSGFATRVTAEDIERTRADLAKAFHDVLAARLTRAGYALADADGPDVVRLTPALRDVRLDAPDVSSQSVGASKSFVLEAGRMTLGLRLADSVSGDELARIDDAQRSMWSSRLRYADSVTNSAELRQVLGDWAGGLVKTLAEFGARPKSVRP